MSGSVGIPRWILTGLLGRLAPNVPPGTLCFLKSTNALAGEERVAKKRVGYLIYLGGWDELGKEQG